MNQKSSKFITPVMAGVLFALALASPSAAGQRNATTPAMPPAQTDLLPGNGAPLVVTPEVHLITVVPPVGASNATAGNTAGATNATATLLVSTRDITAVPQYAGAMSTVTITPVLEKMRGAAPGAPEVHLGSVVPSVGASSATAGNTAGATNATATLPVIPRVITAAPQYAVAGSTVTIIQASEETRGAVLGTFDAGPGIAPGGEQEVVLGTWFDRGADQSGALVLDGNTGGKSLGEISRQYRKHAAIVNAYTNEDIEHVNQQPGLSGRRLSNFSAHAQRP